MEDKIEDIILKHAEVESIMQISTKAIKELGFIEVIKKLNDAKPCTDNSKD